MTSPHPFRFGALMFQPAAGTWADTARNVESLGYASIGLTDHFQAQHAPIPTMAAITAATTELIAASMVLDNDFRHPLVLAKELATLDAESKGRIEFGIGAGWKRLDYDVSGIAYDAPGVRVGRMIEAVTIIRNCFAGEPFSFTGEHYTVTDYTALPAPYRAGGPRLFIGGGGPRVLRFAGSVADIVGINPNLSAGTSGLESRQDTQADSFAQKRDWVAQGAGDRIDGIEFTTIADTIVISDSETERAAAFEAAVQHLQLPLEVVKDMPTILIASVDEAAELLIERRERFGLSYFVCDPSSIEAFAPVVARLAGR